MICCIFSDYSNASKLMYRKIQEDNYLYLLVFQPHFKKISAKKMHPAAWYPCFLYTNLADNKTCQAETKPLCNKIPIEHFLCHCFRSELWPLKNSDAVIIPYEDSSFTLLPLVRAEPTSSVWCFVANKLYWHVNTVSSYEIESTRIFYTYGLPSSI